jgi:hypothetical protein
MFAQSLHCSAMNARSEITRLKKIGATIQIVLSLASFARVAGNTPCIAKQNNVMMAGVYNSAPAL